MKLSQRLETIASFLSEGTFFADIGTDHAYLPCYVCSFDKNARAIAGEVAKGPFQIARETVKFYGLEDVITVRLGNGLDILKNDQIYELVIAGMGGSLITEILEKGKNRLKSVQRMILQPNIGEYNVRKWLQTNDFHIIKEVILKDNNHIYEIIVAEKSISSSTDQIKTTEKELFFGPFLLKEKSPVFYEKWFKQLSNIREIIEQMNRARVKDQEKICRFKLELKWIEEVLQNAKTD